MTATKGFVVPAGGGKHFHSPTPGRSFALKLLGRETNESIMLSRKPCPPAPRASSTSTTTEPAALRPPPRFAQDSPLEGAVYCELVSEVRIRCRFRQRYR